MNPSDPYQPQPGMPNNAGIPAAPGADGLSPSPYAAAPGQASYGSPPAYPPSSPYAPYPPQPMNNNPYLAGASPALNGLRPESPVAPPSADLPEQANPYALPATYQTAAQVPAPPAAPPLAYAPPSAAPTGYASQVAPEAPQNGMPPNLSKPTIAPRVNPNSTQNALEIAEVRDGIVIMNDGSFRSVVMVKSINFDLMSPQEREAVEYSYQGFLNSLYFPIQIFIRSQKVDLRPYLEKLDKIRSEHDNMLLALLMEDYIAYMDQLSQQTNIMDKKFYVVIPYFPTVDVQKALSASKNLFSGLVGLVNNKPQHVIINEADLETAKAELRNRVQAVLGGLLQCGVQGLPLDTQELIELYYDSYNPDTATRQELKDFNDLEAPIVTKGTGSAPQPNLDRELM